jgi:hypothetical protein
MRTLCLITLMLILAATLFAAESERHPASQSLASGSAVTASRTANPIVPAGIDETDTTLFSENFESGGTGWTSQDLTDIGPQWHPSPFNGYSGNSWWCGDSTDAFVGYYNCWLQYLVTPTIDLQGISNPQLTFRVRWAVENPGVSGQYNGYDGCNVWISTDNGSNWQVLNPLSPAYNASSLKSFGAVFGMGPNIPGWVDSTSGLNWQTATFNLSAFPSRNVKIRWALCSDGAVCSFLHPGMTGYFVDNILVSSGADTLLFNDADGNQIGGPLTTAAGPGMGDYWALSTLSSHSPTHSERVDNDHYYLSDMLISPPIPIPVGYTTKFRYWVLCDLPDSTHPSSTNPNMLRDFYVVWARPIGGEWDTLFFDYARGGAGYPGWSQMVPGIPYNGNIDMDLSAFAGLNIQLGWQVVLDGDDLNGHGQGLFIDDVEVYATGGLPNDVGIKSLHIPFPTTLYDTLQGTATISNFGGNSNAFYAFWRTDLLVHTFGLGPSWYLPGLTDSSVSFAYLPTETGAIFMDAYTVFAGDQNHANDTSWAGAVEIFPIGEWLSELGYDARGYSYEDTLLSLHYNQGHGPMVHFLQNPHTGWSWVRVFFWQTGSFTAHFYNGDFTQTVGSEMGSMTIDIGADEIYPNWKVITIDPSAVPGMEYRMMPFWIWFEMTQPGGGPNIVGDVEHFGQGHYFDYTSSALTAIPYEVYMRALQNDAIGVLPGNDPTQPSSFRLETPHPNPFNPTMRIAFTLPGSGDITLSVYDLSGRQVAVISQGQYTSGHHEETWEAGTLSSGIYLIKLESPFGAQIQKAVLVK